MPLNIEKSAEQDKEQSKEWLVNTDPGPFTAPPYYWWNPGNTYTGTKKKRWVHKVCNIIIFMLGLE